MSLADTSTPVARETDLLAMPEFRQHLHRISVESYHEISRQGIVSERTELLRGIIFDKMSESPLHVFITKKILVWLLASLEEGWTVRPANPITTADSEPEPDFCVVQGTDEDFLDRHPRTAALAIEVAISSEKLDQLKASIYAEAGINEYWIVYGERREVQVHLKPRNGHYTETKTFYPGESLKPALPSDLSIAVDSLFPKKKSEE